ncbi:putative lipid II flippase FtsW [Desertivibrio insolitus]|uniref:putative lipid II flippase FtsW n=1 Tax=Herbiconiux sp. SYSU D00978 TaxID=2812562 RepID=UPI001A978743|nr:putative lipid II flippase FtsW [Herbiconiux sp. SYSU D00978]
MTTTPRSLPRRRPTEAGPRPNVARVAVRRIFKAETTDFFLLLGTTVFIVLFGLVMVLSSSSIEARSETGSAFGAFTRQAVFGAAGIAVMLLASRAPIFFWKKWAPRAILFAIGFQLLVFTPLGIAVGGNRNWVDLGLFTAQPSETVKLALVLWLAFMLSSRPELLDDWRKLGATIAPFVVVSVGLVLGGHDLGTGIVLIILVFGALFFGGVRLRYLGVAAAGAALVGFALSQVGGSRVSRISAWLNGCTEENLLDVCWQPQHGTWALAAGGLFGRGLGNSDMKWNWLPEADNDYIFAIIGEELGLVGAVLVLGLFVLLAITFVRIIRSSRDPFAKIATAAVMTWIIGQALINIAVVLGVLPVLGVPLPMISAGGSALIVTLLGVGIVLSFTRTRPEPVQEPLS